MKNNHEAMPNHAPEPQKPDFSEDDIEQLVGSFKEGRSEEEMRKSAESIESMIAETLTDIDEKEKAQKVERTGIIYSEAAKAAGAVMKENLNMAMQMADTPEGAVLLINPVQEKLQKTLDPAGGFGKLHADPKIQQLYKVFTDKIRHEAILAVKTELERRLETAEGPDEISKLHKLLATVEGNDPGGDEEKEEKEKQEREGEARRWAREQMRQGKDVRVRLPDGGSRGARVEGFDIQTGEVIVRLSPDAASGTAGETTRNVDAVELRSWQEEK